MWSEWCTLFGMLDVWADISDAQTAKHCYNELGSTLISAQITTCKYVVHYITSLFQKVILLHNMLLRTTYVVSS